MLTSSSGGGDRASDLRFGRLRILKWVSMIAISSREIHRRTVRWISDVVLNFDLFRRQPTGLNMAKIDIMNQTKFWVAPQTLGMKFLHAHYKTHVFAPHVHDELIIGITEEGAGYFSTNSREYLATPGSVIVFNPNEPHFGGVQQGAVWSYRALYLDSTAISNLNGQIFERDCLVYFNSSLFDDRALASGITLAHKLSQGGCSNLEMDSCLLDAVATLLARYGTPTPKPIKIGKEHWVVSKVKDYMQAHFSTDLRLADLSKTVDMTEFQLVRAFKKETGLTPHTYLNQVSLAHARKMLSAGEPFSVIASDVGFYDQSHLIRIFKQSFGFTPGQYATATKE